MNAVGRVRKGAPRSVHPNTAVYQRRFLTMESTMIPKNNMDNEAARLHPASWHELRQLVLLHGIASIRAALDKIEKEDHDKQVLHGKGR